MNMESATTVTKEHLMDQQSSLPTYVLVTPARNEEAFLAKTIESVIRQTVRPEKWVIVNDGSTDSTGEIVRKYAEQHDWIELVNRPVRKERNFAAKVHSFNAGRDRLQNIPYQIIGNLDGDVAFDDDHFEFLMNKFKDDPRLGVAGTVFKEEGGYSSETRSFEGQNHVSGQCQLFRRECFDEIGGYFANEGGAIDWIAVTTARMIGWKTRSYREKFFFHFRHMGTAERSVLASSFFYGEKDYWTGSHPLWQLFRAVYRMTNKPYLIDGIALGSGYMWAAVRRVKRPISKELITFYRKEQMQKLRVILKSALTFKPIDKFTILP